MFGARFGILPWCRAIGWGACGWAMCRWCEYWVRLPSTYYFGTGKCGAVCDWCEKTFCTERMVPMGSKHWRCTVPNERSVMLDCLRKLKPSVPESVLWHITLFATHPNKLEFPLVFFYARAKIIA